MAVGYRVEKLRLESGERISLLLDSTTGIPLWDATLYILTEVRGTNRAASTIDQVCRAVMVALQVFDHRKIDLSARLANGKVLELNEIDELARLAGFTQKALDALVTEDRLPVSSRRVVSLEKVRMGQSAGETPPQVASETKAIRLMYIRKYIAWVARRALLKLDHRQGDHQAMMTAAQWMNDALAARTPDSNHNAHDQRQGVGAEMRARILEVVDPASPENPWVSHHVRERNQLIFHWLLLLGLRNGELLSVKVKNVDFRTGEVSIIRNADDQEDKRKNAPTTKTKARLLALGETLQQRTHDYVVKTRRAIPGAKDHGFLFVANGTGDPLSLSAVRKLFQELRTKVPGLPDELTPHILRHTWNDDFSELMDAQGVAPEEEERMRKQAMGWSDSSKMAATYTRRHVQRKANEASLAMQAAAFKKPPTKK